MIDSLNIRKSSLLAFSLGFSGVMIMLFMQAINFHPINIVRPFFQTDKVPSIGNQINMKLKEIKNDFKIKASNGLVKEADAETLAINASAYGGIDFDTGKVIVSKQLNKRLPIASVTKVMSAIVALDLADENESLVVSEKAAKAIPTKIGVVPGQKMTVSELIAAGLITSANDAMQALADGIDSKYGKGTFVNAMNEKSEILKLSNTHFANPQGFDDANNYSSVADLAVLSHYALSKYPLIASLAAKDYLLLPKSSNHNQFDLYNWNGLLDVYPGAMGLKIGNTGDAGYTTVVVSQRSGKKIMSIVLGAPGILERDLWASEVLDLAYEDEYSLGPVNITREALLAKYSTWKYWN